MNYMKMICFLILVGITSAFAFGDYIHMRKVEAESIDFSWAKCYYTPTFGGNENYVIAIVIKGSIYNCPYNIKYYPTSGTWE